MSRMPQSRLVWRGIRMAVSSDLSLSLSSSFSRSFLSISSSFSSRASDSQIVVRAPSPWSDAMQGRAAPV
jgi:hypothetical protein